MHYVDSGKYETTEIKKYLQKKETNYKIKLLKYNENKQDNKKPSMSGWAVELIQQALSDSFFHNCGYCGVSVVFNNKHEKTENEGDVDHFIPKSYDIDGIFNWSNYIWSCKACNQSYKKQFYDKVVMIFKPTNKTDCSTLKYDNGRYYISQSEEQLVHQKFEKTQKYTRINSSTNIKKRRALYNDLEKYFKCILFFNESSLDLEYKIKNSSYKLLIKEVFFPKYKKNGFDITIIDIEKLRHIKTNN